jgi:hypothetical protein
MHQVIRNILNEHTIYPFFLRKCQKWTKSYCGITYKFTIENLKIENGGLILNILFFWVHVIKLYMLINVCFKFQYFLSRFTFFSELRSYWNRFPRRNFFAMFNTAVMAECDILKLMLHNNEITWKSPNTLVF